MRPQKTAAYRSALAMGLIVVIVASLVLSGTGASSAAHAAMPVQKQGPKTKLQAATDLYERLLLAAKDDTERRAVVHTFNVLGTSFQTHARDAIRASLLEPHPQGAEVSAVSATPRNLTIDMLQAYAIADRLGPQVSAEARAILAHAKPWLTKTISDSQFQVHYITDTSGCASLSEPDKSLCNASVSTDAYAQKVLDYFSKAYAMEITNWGFRAGVSPGSTKYQAYIYSLDSSPGSITYGGIGIDDTVKGAPGYDTVFGLNLESVLGSDDVTLDVVAHEYHHAGQFKYVDESLSNLFVGNGSLWMVEGGAASIGYQVRTAYSNGPGSVSGTASEAVFLDRVNAFQAYPDTGLLYGNRPSPSVSDRYLATLFAYYVGANKKTGNMSLLSAFWDKMAANNVWNAALKSWNQALGGSASTPYQKLDDKFIEFGVNNLFVNATYAASVALPTPHQVVALDTDLATGKAEYTGSLESYGLHYYKLERSTSKRSLIVEFEDTGGSAFKVKLVREHGGAMTDAIDVPLDANSKGKVSAWNLDVPAGDTGYVVVARVAKADPESTFGVYKLTIREMNNFAFVIDDTGSMTNYIEAVKISAKLKVDLMSIFNPDWNWSLITFKDDVTYRGTTKQPTQIKGWLDSLDASGGGDCPEESLGALRLVPSVSPNSDAWLMTDASPHGGAIALAKTIADLRAKNVTVYPFILGWCSSAAASASASGDVTALAEVDVKDTQLSGRPPMPAQSSSTASLDSLSKSADAAGAQQKDEGKGLQQQGAQGIASPELNGTNLYVSLSSEDSRLVQGQPHQYSIYASTNGISATNMVLTFTMPPGVSYVSTTVQSPSQAGAGVIPTVNGNSVVWNLGLVPTTGGFWNQQFYVDTTVAANAILGSTVATATISTADSETNYFDNQSTRDQQVLGPFVDLAVYKTANATSVLPGERVTYTIKVDNWEGAMNAANVHLTDTLPAGVTFITATLSASLTVRGNQLIWSLGTIRKGVYLDPIYVYTQFDGVSVGQEPINTVRVGGTDAESNPFDNVSLVGTHVATERDTLGGISLWSALAEATGGHLIYLPGRSSAELTAASDIVFNEMTQDARLARQAGSLPTLGTKSYMVTVDGSMSAVNFFLNGKPSSALSLTLIAPDGSVIGETAALVSAAAPMRSSAQSFSFTKTSLIQYYRVFNPVAGQWQVVVSGQGDYILSSSGLTPLEFFYAGKAKFAKGKPTTLLAVLKGPHASHTFHIRKSDGTAVQDVMLYDDGLHSDGLANDGTFGGTWTANELGDFVLAATGTLSGGSTFERIDAKPFTVQTLAVSVSASPSGVQVLPGTATIITFTVMNGGSTTDSFNLNFSALKGWANLTGLPGAVTLAPDQSATIPVQVTVPTTATAGSSEQVRLLAVSQANGLLSDDNTAEIIVGTAVDVLASSIGPAEAIAGEMMMFTVTVGNNGSTPAPGVVVMVSLPAAFSYVSDSSGVTPVVNGNLLTWNLGGAVAVGQVRTIVVTVRVAPDAAGQAVVSTSASSSAIEKNPANNAFNLAFAIRHKRYLPVITREE